MSPTVTVVHPDGSTETIPETTRYTRTREIGKMRRARITVERGLASAVSLTRKRDRIQLGSIDDLVLVDLEKSASTVTLVCYSYEWLANRVAFMAGGEERQGDDQSLITGLISDVPEWTAGSINSFTGPMTWIFNHAHRHDALRRIERNTPGEIRFRDQGSVDYVDTLGTDKSGSVELSGDAGTIEEEIQIVERGREMDGTHIRVLGAHEGEAQISANLVPQSDPQSYENEVRYSTPRWSSGDDTDWNRWEDKDITDQGALEEEAAALADELTDDYVEAKATVSGVDLSLGDRVQVVKPSQDLDRTMRVHRIQTVQEGATRTDTVRLSTRTTLRQDDSDLHRDVRKFNAGFQGSSVVVNAGPFGKAVDSGDPFTFKFRYPNLAFENTAEVQVTGLPYRIDSVGAADGGGVTTTTESGGAELVTSESGGSVLKSSGNGGAYFNTESSNANTAHTQESDFQTDVGLVGDTGGSWTIADTFSFADPAEFILCGFVCGSQEAIIETRVTADVSGFDIEYPRTEGVPIANSTSTSGNGSAQIIFVPEDADSVTLEYRTNFDANTSLFVWAQVMGQHTHDVTIDIPDHQHQIDIPSHTHDVDIPSHVHQLILEDHTHPPLPGIFTTNDVPSNVDVAINGNSVATNIGTGTFETTVDVGGEFNNDAWNDVEVSSDSLGIVEVSAFIEGYDKIGTQSP
jgi:hypothetical protein